MKKNSRKLKIHAKHKSTFNREHNTVPEIKLCGRWLSDWGFHQGQSVLITCEEDRLVITLISQ